MNIPRKLVTAAAVILLATVANSVHAQSLSETLRQLSSNDYKIRRAGFYRIISLANADDPASARLSTGGRSIVRFARGHPEVATALIALLERENLPDPAKDALTEDAYYGDLIGAVAALKDPLAVNALLGAVITGAMAERGLAALGQAAAPGLLAKLRSANHEAAREAAARTLGMIAARRRALASDLAAIKAGLLNALSDPSLYVRWSAVDALAHFSGPDVRRAMERIATTDTAARSGGRIYPVRAAALAWLRHDDSVRAGGSRR